MYANGLPTNRQIFSVQGMSLVVEGEVMQPRPGHMGSVELQTNFHPLWSEGMQLYWKEFKPGDKLSLVFDSEVEGTYYAKIQFTVARLWYICPSCK